MKERRFQPDERDWQIIGLLRAGTISSSAVAEKLGVSEGMVRQRIKRMRDAGVLSLRGLINPDILPDRQIVILGAKVASSRQLAQKAEEVAALPDVLSVSIVSGRYDIMIELLLDSHRGLVRFLTEVLSTVDGIQSTESFVALRNYSKFV
jgi:Lrp/AsnC family transcriptional regulator, regulator for asnA, asnC and gidA